MANQPLYHLWRHRYGRLKLSYNYILAEQILPPKKSPFHFQDKTPEKRRYKIVLLCAKVIDGPNFHAVTFGVLCFRTNKFALHTCKPTAPVQLILTPHFSHLEHSLLLISLADSKSPYLDPNFLLNTCVLLTFDPFQNDATTRDHRRRRPPSSISKTVTTARNLHMATEILEFVSVSQK